MLKTKCFQVALLVIATIGLGFAPAGDALAGAYALCWCVLQASRLLSDAPLDPGALGEGARAFLLRETGADTLAAAQRKLAEATDRAAGVIDAALGTAGKGDEV